MEAKQGDIETQKQGKGVKWVLHPLYSEGAKTRFKQRQMAF